MAEDSAVEGVLRAEYGLLCIGDTFKKAFDEYAAQQNVKTIPRAFYTSLHCCLKSSKRINDSLLL